MNMFERQAKLAEEIENKSRNIVNFVHQKMTEMAGGETGDRDFLFRCHGYNVSTHPYELHETIENPHYNPDLPHTPENRAKDTGFKNITKVSLVVNISCAERSDPYEDWPVDGKFHLYNIPYQMWFDEDLEAIGKLIEEREAENLERDRINAIESKYYPLYELSVEEIEKFLASYKEVEAENPDGLMGKHFAEIIQRTGALDK